MGSSSTEEKAYIAGFLDGDGSLMLQIKRRGDTSRGIRLMATICLYQDTRHEQPLYWMRARFGVGYISRRNDGMTELRINGYGQVGAILKALLPYLQFKKIQATELHTACRLLGEKPFKLLTRADKVRLVTAIMRIQNENYATRRKRSKSELFQLLSVTP